MKRILQILILLFVFYYIIQIIFDFTNKGYDIQYSKKIDNDEFNIREVYNSNQKNEKDNYYLEISTNNETFYFKTYENLKKSKNIVYDIKYIKTDNYSCILPITKDKKLISDILCQNDDSINYYHNIIGFDSKIDEFANSIEEYNVNNWVDSDTETSNLGNVFVYRNNVGNNLYLGLTSYNGLYNINNTVSKGIINVSVFNNDIYNPEISIQINNYYLVADYNEAYEFTQFYLINLLSKEVETIKDKFKISLNSYFLGKDGNSAYLLDIDNKKQYEIDIKSKKITEVGNDSIGVKIYDNGKFENKNIYDVINNKIKFTYSDVDSSLFNEQFYKIDKIGGDKSGYYYLYELSNNGYKVYKSYVEQPNKKIYLFETSRADKVKYINDSVIFIRDNFVNIYNDEYGEKKLIKYNELEFNKNINIYGYYRK